MQYNFAMASSDCKRIRQPAFLLGWYTCLTESQRSWCVCWTILLWSAQAQAWANALYKCFLHLFVHEVGYRTADQSSLMICVQLCDIYNSNLHSQWTCTVLWHCKVNSCRVWHQCSLILKYEHHGVSHYPSQSVSLTAMWMGQWLSHFCVVNVK